MLEAELFPGHIFTGGLDNSNVENQHFLFSSVEIVLSYLIFIIGKLGFCLHHPVFVGVVRAKS